METLFQAIASQVTFSDELGEELKKRLEPQSFSKKETILNENQVCTKSYFIQRGILRLYYYKEGKEITEFFCGEGEWMNSPRSFMQQETDFYYIDAVEDTEALALHINDLGYLFEHFREMDKYARMDMADTFVHIMDRLASIRFSTAQEKYDHFLESYPTIHHRIPLGMVASYIGITQETLSRLRGNR